MGVRGSLVHGRPRINVRLMPGTLYYVAHLNVCNGELLPHNEPLPAPVALKELAQVIEMGTATSLMNGAGINMRRVVACLCFRTQLPL